MKTDKVCKVGMSLWVSNNLQFSVAVWLVFTHQNHLVRLRHQNYTWVALGSFRYQKKNHGFGFKIVFHVIKSFLAESLKD